MVAARSASFGAPRQPAFSPKTAPLVVSKQALACERRLTGSVLKWLQPGSAILHPISFDGEEIGLEQEASPSLISGEGVLILTTEAARATLPSWPARFHTSLNCRFQIADCGSLTGNPESRNSQTQKPVGKRLEPQIDQSPSHLTKGRETQKL